MDTVEASGRGTVFSYVVMHHPPFPAFDPPYAVGLVELAEGVRIISNVVGVAPDEVRIGLPVRLEFLRWTPSWSFLCSGRRWADGLHAHRGAGGGLRSRGQIFGDLSTHERLAAAGTGTDAELWKALCGAGLWRPSRRWGLLGLVLALEEQGRTTAQVPFAASCVYGVLALTAHGTAEQRDRLLPGPARGQRRWRPERSPRRPAAYGATGFHAGELSGAVPLVPWLRDATHVLVPDEDGGLWLVRVADAGAEPVETTAPWAAGRLRSTAPRPSGWGGGGVHVDVLATARTAFAGLQAGVCAGSLARAVRHTRPGSSSGAPCPPIRACCCARPTRTWTPRRYGSPPYEAAWRRDEGLPYGTHALTAAWWASEAGPESCMRASICTAASARTSNTPSTGTSCGGGSWMRIWGVGVNSCGTG